MPFTLKARFRRRSNEAATDLTKLGGMTGLEWEAHRYGGNDPALRDAPTDAPQAKRGEVFYRAIMHTTTADSKEKPYVRAMKDTASLLNHRLYDAVETSAEERGRGRPDTQSAVGHFKSRCLPQRDGSTLYCLEVSASSLALLSQKKVIDGQDTASKIRENIETLRMGEKAVRALARKNAISLQQAIVRDLRRP